MSINVTFLAQGLLHPCYFFSQFVSFCWQSTPPTGARRMSSFIGRNITFFCPSLTIATYTFLTFPSSLSRHLSLAQGGLHYDILLPSLRCLLQIGHSLRLIPFLPWLKRLEVLSTPSQPELVRQVLNSFPPTNSIQICR